MTNRGSDAIWEELRIEEQEHRVRGTMNEISMHRNITEDIFEAIYNSSFLFKEIAAKVFARIDRAIHNTVTYMAQSLNAATADSTTNTMAAEGAAAARAGLLLDKYGDNIKMVK